MQPGIAIKIDAGFQVTEGTGADAAVQPVQGDPVIRVQNQTAVNVNFPRKTLVFSGKPTLGHIGRYLEPGSLAAVQNKHAAGLTAHLA